MNFNLALGYVVKPQDKKPDNYLSEDRQVTELLIRNAITSRFPAGSKKGAEQRTGGKIQKILTTAVKDKVDVVDFDLDQVKWIGETIKDYQCQSDWWQWLIDLQDYVDKLLRDADAAEEAKKAADKAKTA